MDVIQGIQSADPEREEEEHVFGYALDSESVPIFSGFADSESIPSAILKLRSVEVSEIDAGRKLPEGIIDQPMDLEALSKLIEVNTYHSACLDTHVSFVAGHGIGVIDEAATRALLAETPVADRPAVLPVIDETATDQLYAYFAARTPHGIDSILRLVAKGYLESGQSYAEIELNSDGGLAFLDTLCPAGVWRRAVDADRRRAQTFEYRDETGGLISYAPFGQSQEYRRRYLEADLNVGGEVIDFVRVTDRWDHYGEAMWTSALPSIELDRRALQRVSDYWFNRAVPDHVVIAGGINLSEPIQRQIAKALSSGQGRRRGAAALVSLGTTFNKERSIFDIKQVGVALDGGDFRDNHGTVNLSVASSWRMPPVLAGITVPGRMGASNEIINAIVLLQASVTTPIQRYLAQRLNCSLFSSDARGPTVPGMAGRRIRFRTVAETIDLPALSVVARQREQVAENPDRDPSDGLERG